MKWVVFVFRKAPRWAISAGIILTCSGVFVLWLLMRSSTVPSIIEHETAPASFEDSVFVGNALVNYKSGTICTKQWLVGGGSTLPAIVRFLPDEKLVLVGIRGSVRAIGYIDPCKIK